MAARLEDGRILLDEIELRKFYSLCVVDLETGCWNWAGRYGGNDNRYGIFYLRLDGYPKELAAHIVSYNHFVGAVPVGLELGHYNLANGVADRCAFWEHVRPVTHQENIAEAFGSTCKYGHNVARWGRDLSGGGGCKVCRRISHATRHGIFVGCHDCGYSPCRCSSSTGDA